jgi:predicted MFS family arabinose efflux permease
MARDERRERRRRTTALLSPLRLHAFRRLWAADMISLLGDWAARLALAVLVFERTGSSAWAGAVTAVSLAGYVGIGQVLATLADRYGRISVMLVADVARAGLFLMMLLDVPVGMLLVLAFLAGLATPPFEAARSAALPDLVPEDDYRDALALSGISVQFSLVLGYALGGLLLLVVEPETALAINAASFLVSALVLLTLRSSPAARPAESRSTVSRSLGDGALSLFGDRMVRRALVFVSVTGAFGTVDEALVVPYAERIGLPTGYLGVLAASIPIGTLIATMAIAGGRRDHHSLLRTAAWCGMVTSAAAAPLFWFEATGALAFLAFAISGGMFAVSIPTNAVIGLRLNRDTRASAMGIAVGILMGSQALGAVVGGLAASVVGPARAIGGALAAAAVYSLWAVVTTPVDAKHLAVGRRTVRVPAPTPVLAPAPVVEPDTIVVLDPIPVAADAVVDLVAIEAAEQPAAGLR